MRKHLLNSEIFMIALVLLLASCSSTDERKNLSSPPIPDPVTILSKAELLGIGQITGQIVVARCQEFPKVVVCSFEDDYTADTGLVRIAGLVVKNNIREQPPLRFPLSLPSEIIAQGLNITLPQQMNISWAIENRLKKALVKEKVLKEEAGIVTASNSDYIVFCVLGKGLTEDILKNPASVSLLNQRQQLDTSSLSHSNPIVVGWSKQDPGQIVVLSNDQNALYDATYRLYLYSFKNKFCYPRNYTRENITYLPMTLTAKKVSDFINKANGDYENAERPVFDFLDQIIRCWAGRKWIQPLGAKSVVFKIK